MNRFFKQVLVLLVIGCLPACSGVTNPSQNKNDPINFVVVKGGFNTQPFNVSKTGEFTVTVTNLSPPQPTNFQFLVEVDQGGCGGAVAAQQFAVVGAAVGGSALITGAYCVIIRDIGSFTTDETVTGTISHP